MKGKLFYIICALAILASCDKVSEAPENLLRPTLMRSYDDPEVQALTDATAGDGVVLLTYITEQGTYNFKLIDNDGNELWTTASNLPFVSGTRLGHVHKAFFEDDGLITVLHQRGRIRYNMQGEEVSRENILFTFNFDIRNVIQGPNGEYIFIGYQVVTTNNLRATATGIDRNGNFLFTHTYTGTTGICAYTGGVTLEDGSYLLSGAYNSINDDQGDAYFITRIGPTGEVLWTVQHPTTDVPASLWDRNLIAGRNMIRTADGNYLFFIEGYLDRQQRIVRFDDTGAETGPHWEIELQSPGYTFAGTGYRGAALAQHMDGSLYFIGNGWRDKLILGTNIIRVQGAWQQPSYGSFARLAPESDGWARADFSRNYNNWLTAVIPLSNGKVMLAGTILSLGVDLKLVIAVQ